MLRHTQAQLPAGTGRPLKGVGHHPGSRSAIPAVDHSSALGMGGKRCLRGETTLGSSALQAQEPGRQGGCLMKNAWGRHCADVPSRSPGVLMQWDRGHRAVCGLPSVAAHWGSHRRGLRGATKRFQQQSGPVRV